MQHILFLYLYLQLLCNRCPPNGVNNVCNAHMLKWFKIIFWLWNCAVFGLSNHGSNTLRIASNTLDRHHSSTECFGCKICASGYNYKLQGLHNTDLCECVEITITLQQAKPIQMRDATTFYETSLISNGFCNSSMFPDGAFSLFALE
jgi:hypothetical protein